MLLYSLDHHLFFILKGFLLCAPTLHIDAFLITVQYISINRSSDFLVGIGTNNEFFNERHSSKVSGTNAIMPLNLYPQNVKQRRPISNP